MHEQLVSRLLQAFPWLPSATEQPSPLHAYGFQHGNGWYPLVFEFLALVGDIRQRTGQTATLSQTKEKFGALRLYGHIPGDSAEAWLPHLLESLSTAVCEHCGRPGRHGSLAAGGVATLCNTCEQYLEQHLCWPPVKETVRRMLEYRRQGLATGGLGWARGTANEDAGVYTVRYLRYPALVVSIYETSLLSQCQQASLTGDQTTLQRQLRRWKKAGPLVLWAPPGFGEKRD